MQTNRDLDPDIVRSTYSTCEEQDIRHVFSHEEITRMKEEFFEIAADKTFKEELGKSFKAKIEQDIQAADDKKGNKTSSFDQRIQQPHDLRFTLNWPVISGEPKTKFQVEINYDVRDKAIEFWLESVEMHEAIQEQCQALMDGQVALFQEAGITVVEQ